MALDQKIKKALAWEEKRKELLAQGKRDQVLQTYTKQKDFLPDQNDGKFWDQRFSEGEVPFPMEKWRIEKVVSLLDCSRSILNLGVGRGELEKLLIKKCSTLKYLGTDITSSTLKRLRQLFPQLKFKKIDLFSLSPKSNQFDQILLLEVLEHIRPNETLPLLRHIFSLLQKDGKFFISVPVNEGLENMLPVNPNSHMRLYSSELLQFELESVGFTIIEKYQASAFDSLFGIKHAVNSLFSIKQPNNLLFVCKK